MHLFPSKAGTDLSLYAMRKRGCLWVRLSDVPAERRRRQRIICHVETLRLSYAQNTRNDLAILDEVPVP